MSSEFARLAQRIEEALGDVQHTVARVEEQRNKALSVKDDAYWDACSLNLHAFYNGLEHILEDIARTVDGSVPAGRAWHQDLLQQLSRTTALRAPVITPLTRQSLDEYREFRHLVGFGA